MNSNRPSRSKIRLVRSKKNSPFASSQLISRTTAQFRNIRFLLKFAIESRRLDKDEMYDQFKALDVFLSKAVDDGVKVSQSIREDYGFDCEGLLESDYLGLPAPIVLETKYTFDTHSLFYRISKDVYSYLVKGGIQSAIFIVHDSLGNVDFKALQEWMSDRFDGIFNVKIISTEEIMGKKINTSMNKLFLPITEECYSRVTDLDEKTYEQLYSNRINLLRSDIKKRKISVFFGAGVSSSAGFPGWTQLIDRLWWESARGRGEFKRADDKYVIEKLDEVIGNTALIRARTLQEEYGPALMWRLRDLLYPKIIGRSNLVEASCLLIKTLDELGALGQVLTLNYDNLIEEELLKLGLGARPIYGNNNSYDDELCVFHVHGYLPPKPFMLTDEEINSVVFSETSYNMLASNSYSATNMRIIQRFVDDSCVFIGHSMTDPNVRRLLEVSQNIREGVRHHWFKRIGVVERDNRDKYIFSYKIASIQERIMNSMGINVIWYKDHSELPELLKSIQ